MDRSGTRRKKGEPAKSTRGANDTSPALREVRVRYRHTGCWIQETTEHLPDIMLLVATSYIRGQRVYADVTAHAAEAATIRQARSMWTKDPRIQKVSTLYSGPQSGRFHVVYGIEHSIVPDIFRSTPITRGPTRHQGGFEHYHFIGYADDIQGLLRDLSKKGDLQMESSRTLAILPVEADEETPDGPAEGLTTKQLSALAVAHAEGFYRRPRAVSASELAGRLGVSTSAFVELLRRAEGKAIDRFIQQVRDVDPTRMDAARARRVVSGRAQKKRDGP